MLLNVLSYVTDPLHYKFNHLITVRKDMITLAYLS